MLECMTDPKVVLLTCLSLWTDSKRACKDYLLNLCNKIQWPSFFFCEKCFHSNFWNRVLEIHQSRWMDNFYPHSHSKEHMLHNEAWPFFANCVLAVSQCFVFYLYIQQFCFYRPVILMGPVTVDVTCTKHSIKAMPLVLPCSSRSQSISKWKLSFFMFAMLPEKSSAFLKMLKNLHFTNFSITINAPSQAVYCHQLSSTTYHTHFTVKTCQQWLLPCNFAKNEAIHKTGCC